MHKHGSSPMEGPLRGSNGWWRGMAAPDVAASADSGQDDALPDRDDPRIRWTLVRRIRREIAAGTYDSPERWNEALNRFLDDLEKS